MIRISDRISIPDGLLEEHFIHASGPGGQHVNKVATAVQLRFNVPTSPLPVYVKNKLKSLAGKKMTEEGVLIIDARQYRSREKNRTNARERLVRLIKKALVKPKKRIKTRPSAASKKKRLENKRHRSKIKSTRRKVSDKEE